MLTTDKSIERPHTTPTYINKQDVAEKTITTPITQGMACVGIVPAAEVQVALDLLLTSKLFIHAQRRSRLLKFLVEKAVDGTIRDTSEHSIGIEVFDRNPALYSTYEDPIVRVYIGRLRDKLNVYYAAVGADSDIEISIPLGSYMPLILRKRAECIKCNPRYLLAISPFKCISRHSDGHYFTHGLDEMLKHQLFKTFGKIIVLNSAITSGVADHEDGMLKRATDIGISHLLEGSVQFDVESIRVSIRLVDTLENGIIWSEQFGRHLLLAIAQQEEIAASICSALQDFFIANDGVIANTGCQII
jgi:TolB-like protein